jgi:hypothetical protein
LVKVANWKQTKKKNSRAQVLHAPSSYS